MQQILKRLELISSSIEIGDEEIVELQVKKLKALPINAEVQNIIDRLNNLDYSSVVSDIKEYMTKHKGLTSYEDKELSALRLELKVLEKRLQELNESKNEYLNE